MEPHLKTHLGDNHVHFKFNPPSTPHFGRVWECKICSIKNTLQVVVGYQAVMEDILFTVLVEEEGILKLKPLGYASTDIVDIYPILPNLLLIGWQDGSLPQVAYVPGDMGRQRRLHYQNIMDQLWIYFMRNYLPMLHTWQRWHRTSGNLSVDSVVLIVEPQLPRGQWPIGKVCKTLPSIGRCEDCRSYHWR